MQGRRHPPHHVVAMKQASTKTENSTTKGLVRRGSAAGRRHQIGGERVGLIGRALQQIGEIADALVKLCRVQSDDSRFPKAGSA